MGGSLLGAERMPLEKFKELMSRFLPELRKALGDTEFTVVPYYSEKEDFGDLDILVKEKTDVVRASVVSHFGLPPEHKMIKLPYSTNHNCFSFLFEKFQVDLICTIPDYETSIAYYSFNDVGNILGRFFHKFGLKFGHQGLLYPLRDERGIVRKELVVCKDQKLILEFLGLSFDKWDKGFSSLEDIFEWVATGKYFDPNIFMGELSAINEKRDRKRRTFSRFLDWVEEAKPKQNYEFMPRDQREEYIPLVETFFGCDIKGGLDDFKFDMEIEKKLKEKFNGEIVMEITGLKGKELGTFMGNFQKYDDGSFEQYILETSPEDIRQYIKTVFELQKQTI